MPDLIALAERLTNQAPRELSAWQTELMLEAAAALREAHERLEGAYGSIREHMNALREAHAAIERLSLADAEDVAEVERLRGLLREARSYVVADHGWDYENGGWLADRIDAALAGEKP